MAEAEDLRLDSEVEELADEESKSVTSGWGKEEIETIFEGLDRLADKILEYEKLKTMKDKEIELKEKDLEKTKYLYWLLATVGVAALVGGILAAIYFLARGGVISSEGVSFLLGTIAGYLFSVFGGLISNALKPRESET